MNVILLILALIFACSNLNAAEDNNRDQVGGPNKAGVDEARIPAAKANGTEPKDSDGYLIRAQLHEQRGETAKALADYDQALKLDPLKAKAWQNRGIIHFRLALIDQSISDFDQFLKLVPAQAPYHWQRGICCYYAGRFEDGRKQFELHQTVNPNDVENAVWHFLCVAHAVSLEKARASLMPIRDDARVPMRQIHELFAGKASSEDVLKAARAGEPAAPELRRRLFYAHLYLGLYAEAMGKEGQAREHVSKAVHEYGDRDYMSDVARVHLVLREAKEKK